MTKEINALKNKVKSLQDELSATIKTWNHQNKLSDKVIRKLKIELSQKRCANVDLQKENDSLKQEIRYLKQFEENFRNKYKKVITKEEKECILLRAICAKCEEQLKIFEEDLGKRLITEYVSDKETNKKVKKHLEE